MTPTPEQVEEWRVSAEEFASRTAVIAHETGRWIVLRDRHFAALAFAAGAASRPVPAGADVLTRDECMDLLCKHFNATERLQAAARLGAERERERAAREREVLQYEVVKSRAMFGAAIGRLTRIQSFVHPDGFVVNGRTYGFHPPDNLVRELWEALSKAIREIDIEAIRRGEGE